MVKQPKCRFGFKRDDVVWTPMRRRAILTHYRANDERWDARYLAAIDGSRQEETILNPKLLTPA